MKNTRKAITPLLGSIAALLLGSALPPSAQAGQNWDGNGGLGTNVWTNATNWDADTLPSFLLPLNFTTAFKLANTNDNPAGTIMNGIGFDGGAGAFVLSGNLINLASGGVVNNSANLQTINLALTLSGANTFAANTANLTFTTLSPIILGGNVLTLQGANTITFNTNIDVLPTTGSLVINGGAAAGSGTVAFNSAGPGNNYAGPTNVNNGLVTMTGASTTTLGTGILTIGDGIGAQGTAIVRNLTSNMLSNTQALLIDSDGRYDLNGLTETVGSIASTGATQANSQIFLGNGGALTSGNGTNTTFQGIISDAGATGGSITKLGTGVWTLTGANTYKNGTTVTAGTLAVGDVNAGGGSGSTVAQAGLGVINVGAAGTLRWDLASGQAEFNNMGLIAGSIVNATPAAGGFQTLSGLIFGTGTFNQNGPGLTILTFTNTFSGPVNVLAGSLSVGNASTGAVNNFATVGALANVVTVNGGIPGATLFVALQPNESFSHPVTLTGAADQLIFASPFAQTVSGLITGPGSVSESNFANTGATTVTNAGNTYSGGTTINGGTLNINANNAAVGGGVPAAGPIGTGPLRINGGGIGTTTAGGGANNHAIGNPVTINGSFAVSTITGAPVLPPAPPAGVPNATVGTPQVNSLTAVNGDGLTFTNTTTLNGPITMTTNSGFLDFSGAIVGTGGLTFAGNTYTYLGSSNINNVGTILTAGQLDASNTYTGLTTVNGTGLGSLLALGKTNGAFAIPGNLQIDAGATVFLDSGSPNFVGFGTTANQINPVANVLVNGKLDLSGINQAINNLTGAGNVELDDVNGLSLGTASIFTVNSGLFTGSIFDNGKGGQLVKNSPGTLILTGNNPYVGNTTINAGTLQVDGFIGSKNTFVNLLGTLSGSGIVGGNVINGGLVSPGHSPGTLTVKGNYTQTAAGTLLIEVAGKNAGQFDVLAVGGKATLAGTVRILNTGNVRLHLGQKITFLTAAGGVAGKFGTEVVADFNDGTLTKAKVVYNTNSVVLTTKLGSFAGIPGLTENQEAVAQQLDKSGQSKKLLNFLGSRQINKLPGDLDKIAPEELASFFNIGVSLANVQSANLERRMGDIQAGSAGFSASGYSMGGSGPSYSGGAGYNSGATSYGGYRGPEGQGGKEMRAPGEPIPVGVFITGVGEFTNIGNTANAQGYDLTTGGFTLGVDVKLTEHFAIGINAGYARTGADLTGNGRVTVDGAKGGIYATYFTGTGFYVDAAASAGYNNYDTRRGALKGTARGSTSGAEFNALFSTGYDWKTSDGLSIGPVASVQYTNVGVDSFREHGSLAPLKIGDNTGESLRTQLGVKASYDIHPLASGVIIRPEVRAAWQHEFGDSSFALDSRFANGAGNTFTVHGPEIGDDSLLVGAGVAVLWNERTSTYVYYDGDLARTNYSSHNVSGGVRMSF